MSNQTKPLEEIDLNICYPVDLFGDQPPTDVASYMQDEAREQIDDLSKIDDVSIDKEMERIQTSQIFRTDFERKQAQENLINRWNAAVKGVEATEAKKIFCCGMCAINDTCEVQKILTNRASLGVKKLKDIRKKGEELEEKANLAHVLHAVVQWGKYEAELKKLGSFPYSQQNESKKRAYKKAKSELQSVVFKEILNLDTNEERDQYIDAIYKNLPSSEDKKVFTDGGFIDGLIAELVTYEELKKLEFKIPGLRIELATVSEDIDENFDIKVSFVDSNKKGAVKTIYIDAKAKIPSDYDKAEKIDKKATHFVAMRVQKGRVIYVASPTDKQPPHGSFLSRRFANNEKNNAKIYGFTSNDDSLPRSKYAGTILMLIPETAEFIKGLAKEAKPRSKVTV